MRGVLVVEDDVDMRLMIKMTLRALPELEVTDEAADADAAIEAARMHTPSVIILDNSLEGTMTGLQAAPLLRRVAPDAKILLFSAYDLANEVDGEPAIDGFLRKDSVRHLISTIERLLATA